MCLPTPWDVVRLAKETGDKPDVFIEFLEPDEITGVEDDDPTWLECNGTRYMMALKRSEKGCYFLHPKTKFCQVYESRPILCRLFPFKLQQTRKGEFRGFTLHRDVECARNRDGIFDTGPLYELYLDDSNHHNRYDELVEHFNSLDDDGKKPADFIKLSFKEYS